MPLLSTVELRDLMLDVQIGTFLAGESQPDFHLLDLTLAIDTELVLISEDCMTKVFDYDPLLSDIERLSRDHRYETQERLLTRIVRACAQYPQIKAIEVALRKGPIKLDSTALGCAAVGSGTLGIRLVADVQAWSRLRVEVNQSS
jgi:dihydroneopterin aldolase